MAIHQKNDNVTTSRPDSIVNFFWRCLVSLVRFSYWSYSVVMVIFGYKGLSRNPETRNIPVWFLSNIWRLEKIKDAKFGTNISNKMLMNAVKCQFLPYFSYQEKTSRGVLAHRKSWGRCTKMIMIITSWYDTSLKTGGEKNWPTWFSIIFLIGKVKKPMCRFFPSRSIITPLWVLAKSNILAHSFRRHALDGVLPSYAGTQMKKGNKRAGIFHIVEYTELTFQM